MKASFFVSKLGNGSLTVGMSVHRNKPYIVGLLDSSGRFEKECVDLDPALQADYQAVFEACANELGFKKSSRAKSGWVFVG